MKFAVVAYSDSFVHCLGVFDCAAAAYGEAIMYLSENANEGNIITPLYGLEGETGYGISLRKPGGESLETVYVLFFDEEAQHESSYERC